VNIIMPNTNGTLRERVAKNEVKIQAIEVWLKNSLDTFNDRLAEVIKHSNEDITSLSVQHKEDMQTLCGLVSKQQNQIDNIIQRCSKHDIQSAEVKLVNKVLYFIGGALGIALISLIFEWLSKVLL